jgi:hypothetical protein
MPLTVWVGHEERLAMQTLVSQKGAVTWLGLACGRGLLATSYGGLDMRYPRGHGPWDKEIPFNINNYFDVPPRPPIAPTACIWAALRLTSGNALPLLDGQLTNLISAKYLRNLPTSSLLMPQPALSSIPVQFSASTFRILAAFLSSSSAARVVAARSLTQK